MVEIWHADIDLILPNRYGNR